MSRKQNPKIIAQNPREYVRYWFESRKETARHASKNACLEATMCLDYADFYQVVAIKCHPDKLKKFNDIALKQALEEFMVMKLAEEVSQALVPYECTKEDLGPLTAWVKAVTGSDEPKNVSVMAHWLWMIKRKGLDKPVKHQIMPVLHGPQGGGKTVAIEKLIKPIEQFRLAIGMNQLGDERMADGMSNNYVVVFDELQGVERTDMNALKKQITTTYNTYRKLYSHTVLNVPMRCGFIGATNKPISESFTDSTGMRRFWELNTLSKLDWKVITGIDYRALWTGVDDRLEDGYLKGEMLEAVLTEQHTYTNRDDIDEFILDSVLVGEDNSAEIDSQALYNEYVHWAGRNGITTRKNAIWFNRILKRRLDSRVDKDESGRRLRLYKVNSKSPVLQARH